MIFHTAAQGFSVVFHFLSVEYPGEMGVFLLWHEFCGYLSQ
jgi:hypothetical protein